MKPLENLNYWIGTSLLAIALGTGIAAYRAEKTEYKIPLATSALISGLIGGVTRLPEKKYYQKENQQQ